MNPFIDNVELLGVVNGLLQDNWLLGNGYLIPSILDICYARNNLLNTFCEKLIDQLLPDIPTNALNDIKMQYRKTHTH